MEIDTKMQHNEIADKMLTYFYSQPLRTKLLIFVIGAIAGMLFIGFMGSVSMDVMIAADTRMYEDISLMGSKLGMLSAYAGAYARAASELRSETNQVEIERLTRSLQTSDSAIADISQELLSLPHPEIIVEVEKFINAHENYKRAVEKSFELSDLGYVNEATTLYHMQAGPLYYATQNALFSLIGLQNALLYNSIQSNQEIAKQTKINIIITICIITFIFTVSAWLFIRSLVNRINRCTHMLHELTMGHVSNRLHPSYTDEIGNMGAALDTFAEYLEASIVGTLHALARGEKEIQRLIPSDTQDQIAPALNVMIQTILDLMHQITALAEDAQVGKLDTRGNPDAFVGQYRDIVSGINMMLEFITVPLAETSRLLTKFANVDFSGRFSENIKVQGEFAELKDKIDHVGEHIENILGRTVHEIESQMEQLVASSNLLEENLQTVETVREGTLNTLSQVKKNAEETQESITLASSQITNLNEILTNISSKLDTTNDLSTKMNDVAKSGSEKVKATEQSLEEMQVSIGDAYGHMSQIFKEMQHISVIAKEIRSIADATNILSLNAGLEAGRAGAFGESFGIIADEVKQLAEESFDAAQEIANIIQKLKQQSQKADYSMGQAILDVETGSTTIAETVSTFKEITEQIIQINGQISDIHKLTKQELGSFELIVTHVENVRERNTNTLDQSLASANMSTETTKAIAELHETIRNVTNIIRITQDIIKNLSQNN